MTPRARVVSSTISCSKAVRADQPRALKLFGSGRTVATMTDTVATETVIETPAVAAAETIIAAAETVVPARPDALPETYWDADTNAIKPEAFSRLAELEAADEARRAGVPESADKYELKIDESVVGLDGKPVEFDPTDPLAAAVLPVLHELGIPQEGVSKLLTAFAAQEIEAAKAQQAYVASEQQKLGAEHAKRTAALHATVTAQVGQQAAEAIRLSMGSAAAVEALEQLVSKVTGAAISAAPPSKPHGDLDGLHGAELLAAARAAKAG